MGKAAVILDWDRPRRIRYSMNNMCLLEEKLGYPVTQLNLSALGFIEIRAIVCCGLEDKHDLSSVKGKSQEEFVGDLIDEYSSLDEVSEKIKEAFELAFGSKKEMPV